MKSLGQCDYDFQKLVMKMEAKIEHLSPQEDSRPFCCENCGRQFSTSAYLSQHRRIHSGVKPYVCRFCDRKFTQLSHVQQHERIHTGEKPYSCVTCMKSFTQMSNLHSHQKQHMKNKPCKCSNCFMAFDIQEDLENHIESKHTSEKYHKVLICPICSKMYNSETYLTKHVERHDESSSKSSNCSPKSEPHSVQPPPTKYPRLSSTVKEGQSADHNEMTTIPPVCTSVMNGPPAQPMALMPVYTNQDKECTPIFVSRPTNDMSMALDISKSIVTSASGLRLDVILESLSSPNCASPLVSAAAASVWGHSWFPSSTHAQVVDMNHGISRCDRSTMCIDLMTIKAQSSKLSHQSLMHDMINRNLMSPPHHNPPQAPPTPQPSSSTSSPPLPPPTITLPTLSQITEKFINSAYPAPASSNQASHINAALTTAFPLQRPNQ